jgi:serine/threonine-protein kinase
MLIPREGRRELLRRVNDDSGAHEISERETKFDFVKILDFGVAKVREPEAQQGRVTQAGVVFGTPEYMAPETARIGFSDARSDIYALGVMFYEMLTGVVPFTGEAPVDVMMKQVNDRVPHMHEVAPEAEITDATETMIFKALAKDPEQRQQSMEEFHRDLQKCYGQLRFRRTLKTPTTQTPAVTVIPLTKRKNAVAGEIPSGIRATPSVTIDLEASLPPSTAAGADKPILLLTKKKAPPRADAVAAPAPGQRKRTTLPLGLEGTSPVPGRLPPEDPMGRFAGPRRSPGSAGAAALPRTDASERETPRAPIPTRQNGATDAGELPAAWFDEPTAPGASDGNR